MEEPKYNLERFIHVQDENGAYERALEEMKNGQKASHWIWYIFPQLAGFGHSAMTKLYAITNMEEAKQYLQDETLYSRLKEITLALLSHKGSDILRIMGGTTDALKLRSSMTLFWCASRQLNEQKKGDPIFKEVIDSFFYGTFDDKTVAMIKNPKLRYYH